MVRNNFHFKISDFTKPFSFGLKFKFIIMAGATSGLLNGKDDFSEIIMNMQNAVIDNNGVFLFERRFASDIDFPDKKFVWFKWWEERKLSVAYYRTSIKLCDDFREDIHTFEFMDQNHDIEKKEFKIKIWDWQIEDIEHIFISNNMKIIHKWGDWNFSEFQKGKSSRIIIVAQKKISKSVR